MGRAACRAERSVWFGGGGKGRKTVSLRNQKPTAHLRENGHKEHKCEGHLPGRNSPADWEVKGRSPNAFPLVQMFWPHSWPKLILHVPGRQKVSRNICAPVPAFGQGTPDLAMPRNEAGSSAWAWRGKGGRGRERAGICFFWNNMELRNSSHSKRWVLPSMCDWESWSIVTSGPHGPNRPQSKG